MLCDVVAIILIYVLCELSVTERQDIGQQPYYQDSGNSSYPPGSGPGSQPRFSGVQFSQDMPRVPQDVGNRFSVGPRFSQEQPRFQGNSISVLTN